MLETFHKKVTNESRLQDKLDRKKQKCKITM